MATDIRGFKYDPFLPSVTTADGAVFQVITDQVDQETGLFMVDMVESARLADEHDSK